MQMYPLIATHLQHSHSMTPRVQASQTLPANNPGKRISHPARLKHDVCTHHLHCSHHPTLRIKGERDVQPLRHESWAIALVQPEGKTQGRDGVRAQQREGNR